MASTGENQATIIQSRKGRMKSSFLLSMKPFPIVYIGNVKEI